jgi:hypothetical protein
VLGLSLAGCVNANRVDPYDAPRSPQIQRDDPRDGSVVPVPTEVPAPPRPGPPLEPLGPTVQAPPSAPPPPASIARRGPGGNASAPGFTVAPAGKNASPDAVPVQAMVGQIAGQPIYAHRVLDGLEAQLDSLGRRLPAEQFRRQAAALIGTQVSGLVSNALIQDAAERELTAQQRAQLDFFIEYRRQELLRRFGQGSIALAERNILEETGVSFDQTLRDIRTQTMILAYLDRTLKPLINVSRRDIARYYRDNFDAFNPPTKRTIQLIYAEDEADAAWFVEQLEAGVPFAELAEDPRNAYRGKSASMTVESNESMFGERIDPAVQSLDEGQWAGPLPNRGQQWFIHLAELDQPPRRSQFEAQVDIERQLRAQQEFFLRQELDRKLAEQSSFTDVQQMAQAVLDIAMARYAAAE